MLTRIWRLLVSQRISGQTWYSGYPRIMLIHGTVFHLAILLLLCGCKQSVQPVSLKGDLSASPDLTANETDGPAGPARRRVAFLIDVSQSMLASDPDGARQRAAAEVVSRLSAEDAAFGFLLLSPCLEINAGLSSGFVQNSAIIEQALPGLATGSGLSDPQSGIEAAKRMIADDINASTAEQLARTTYELILVVDGAPSIYCNDGCDPIPCDGGVCLPCDAGVCPTDAGLSPQHELCDLPRTQWSMPPSTSCDDGSDPYPALRQCEPFNVLASLGALAKEIYALHERGPQIGLHVFLLENTNIPQEEERARAVLVPLVEAGRGGESRTFSSFRVLKASELSFVEQLRLQDEGA